MKKFIFVIIALLFSFLGGMFAGIHIDKNDKNIATSESNVNNYSKNDRNNNNNETNNISSKPNENFENIANITSEDTVIEYVKQNGKLPEYYITKKNAQSQGWKAKEGNLCEVLPGRAIGGDKFQNRENQLPDKKGRQWYEADLNYQCGHRGAERLLFSNDGLIFITKNHYDSFIEIVGE